MLPDINIVKQNCVACDWRPAWRKAGLPVNDEYKRGVHNLKHTFGRRLRAVMKVGKCC